VPIISASTRGIDGHGLSAFAHPTGCGRNKKGGHFAMPAFFTKALLADD